MSKQIQEQDLRDELERLLERFNQDDQQDELVKRTVELLLRGVTVNGAVAKNCFTVLKAVELKGREPQESAKAEALGMVGEYLASVNQLPTIDERMMGADRLLAEELIVYK